MSDDAIWPGPKLAAGNKAQAKRLRAQARAGGLRFEAYLPPDLADWLLDHVEHGHFLDPSEAVFVILGDHQELEPHTDLRDELFRRMCQAAIEDPRPLVPHDEAVTRIREQLAGPAPAPAPALWRKVLP